MEILLIVILISLLLTGVSYLHSRSWGIRFFIKKIWGEVVNAKLGLLSFSINFGITYWTHREYSFGEAGFVALKGGLGAFFLGGFCGRLTERFSEIRNAFLAYPLGSIIPTLMAYAIIFTMHFVTGTPKPFVATIFPMLMSMCVNTPTTMFVLRRGFLRQNMTKPAVKDKTWEWRQRRKQARASALESVPGATSLSKDNS